MWCLYATPITTCLSRPVLSLSISTIHDSIHSDMTHRSFLSFLPTCCAHEVTHLHLLYVLYIYTSNHNCRSDFDLHFFFLAHVSVNAITSKMNFNVCSYTSIAGRLLL